MSQKINHQQFITTRQRHKHITVQSPSTKPTHIFSLDFDATPTKNSPLKYKTIDQLLTWKSTRSKFLSKFGRKTTTNLRESDIETISSIELSKRNEGNEIISYRDK